MPFSAVPCDMGHFDSPIRGGLTFGPAIISPSLALPHIAGSSHKTPIAADTRLDRIRFSFLKATSITHAVPTANDVQHAEFGRNPYQTSSDRISTLRGVTKSG
jgi:hypothetical protein